MRMLLFTYLLFSITSLSASTPKIDSLLQVLDSKYINKNDKDDKNNREKGKLLLEIAREYRGIADTIERKMYILEALDLAQKTGMDSIAGDAYFALGNYYGAVGQLYNAHLNFKRAEKIYQKLNDTKRLCNTYYNLKLMFYFTEDFENAAYYAEKLLEIADKQYEQDENMKTFIFASQFVIGAAHFKDSYSEESLQYFSEMFQKSMSMHLSLFYTQILANECAKICLHLNRPREAINYQNIALQYYEKRNMPIMPVQYAYIAKAYAMLNLTDSAEYFLNKAVDSPISKNDEAKLLIYLSQSMIDEEKGNLQLSIEKFIEYHFLSDSLINDSKSEEISRMKNWQALEQKDKENEILQQEKIKQKKLIIILTIALPLIIVLFIISIIIYRKSVTKNSELKRMHTVKDKLFSIISHDLRSPVNSLANTLKIANTLTIDTENKAKLLKNVSSRVDNAYGLIDNLLIWAKNQMKEIEPTPEYFNLQPQINTIITDLQDIITDKSIYLENKTENIEIYTDKDMFTVIMRNLITNAIKYSHSNGKITINVDMSDNNLVISVKDNGIGMTKEVQETLFKMSKTKSQLGTNNETGTGLGLVLCAEFAKKMGGNIWFESKEDVGSTFFFSVLVNNEKQNNGK